MKKHKHENCQQMLGSLCEYVDGEAGEALCAEIERHLADCDDCRVVVDTMRKTIYLVKQSTDESPSELPEGVRQRLYLSLNLDDFLTKQ